MFRDIKEFYSPIERRKIIWSLTGIHVGPLGSADSLSELRDLVARHPGQNPDPKKTGLRSG